MNFHARILSSAAFAGLVVAVFPCPAGAQQAVKAITQRVPAPVGDHHLHLLSPAVVALVGPTHLPPVAVPSELARVLRERERIAGTSTVTDLFTADAQMVDVNGDMKWVRGRQAIHAAIGNGRPGFRLVPNAFSIDGDAAWIAGNTVRGDGATLRHTSNVLLSLKKGANGAWRIAVESGSLVPAPQFSGPFLADSLIVLLNAAGIRRGVVLSLAYLSASSFIPTLPDERERVRAENDWTARQVQRFPERLVGFCSVNPLKDYAVQEMERCVRQPSMRGLKLHFGNSGVDLRKPEHVERVRGVFAAANAARIPIVAHLWTVDSSYGREHSEIFLNRIVPIAPDVPIQIAHMSASGPGYHSDDAIAVFAAAREARDPRVRNLWYDFATIVSVDLDEEQVELATRRIRQMGVDRMLFGSDLDSNVPPKRAWATFRNVLPLSDDEFRVIATNVPPYLR